MPCSCVDCPIACPFTKLDIKSEDTFIIGNFNGYGVVAAILVVLITIVTSGLYTLYIFKKNRKKGINSKKIDLSLIY